MGANDSGRDKQGGFESFKRLLENEFEHVGGTKATKLGSCIKEIIGDAVEKKYSNGLIGNKNEAWRQFLAEEVIHVADQTTKVNLSGASFASAQKVKVNFLDKIGPTSVSQHMSIVLAIYYSAHVTSDENLNKAADKVDLDFFKKSFDEKFGGRVPISKSEGNSLIDINRPRQVRFKKAHSRVQKAKQYVQPGIYLAVAFLSVYTVLYFVSDHLTTSESNERSDEISVKDNEIIARSWSRLLSRQGGNTDKGDALGYLMLDANRDFSGVDLSCKAIGDWDQAKQICLNPPVFANLNLNPSFKHIDFTQGGSPNISYLHADETGPFGKQKAYFWNRNRARGPINKIDFSDIIFSNATYKNGEMDASRFSNASFNRSVFDNTTINGLSENITIEESVFVYSRLATISNSVKISKSNISAMLIADELAEYSIGNGNWIWADLPPMRYISTGKYQGFFSPLPKELFNRIIICEPRGAQGRQDEVTDQLIFVGDDGYLMARSDPRPPIQTAIDENGYQRVKNSYYFLPVVYVDNNINPVDCVRLNFEQAKKMYPDRY